MRERSANPLLFSMRRLLLSALLLAMIPIGLAQTPIRIVVLPFATDGAPEAYEFGLAVGLQRSLNTVDGWFLPPVADGALISTRAQRLGMDIGTVIGDLFEADIVLSGTVFGPEAQTVDLFVSGRALEASTLRVSPDNSSPAAVVGVVVNTVIDILGKDLSASERQELDRMIAQTPSLPSLGSAALSASGLPGSRPENLAIAVGLDPGSSWVHTEHARSLLIAGRLDEGLAASLTAIEVLPTDLEAWAVRGVALLAAEDPPGAALAFAETVRLNPSHALALAALGSINGDIETLERAIDAYPRLVDGHLRLAAAEADTSRALQRLRRATRWLPESVSIHGAVVDLVIAAGDASGAAAYLTEATNSDLGRSAALYALARRLPSELAAEAYDLVIAGLAWYPDAAILQLNAAGLEIDRGESELAVARLLPINERIPTDPDIANVLALGLATLGDVEGAQRVLESAGGTLVTQLNQAILFLEAGRSRLALSLLEPVAPTSDDPRLLTYYAIALDRVGRRDEAREVLDRALAIDSTLALTQRAVAFINQRDGIDTANAVAFEGDVANAFERGLFALEAENLDAARQAFDDARSLGDHPLLAFYHGYSLQLMALPREALAAYQTALEGYPNNDVLLNNVGFTQLTLGRLDLALERFRQALEINPDNARVYVNIGLTYFNLGRYRDALTEWDRAITLDPRLEASIANLRAEANRRLAP